MMPWVLALVVNGALTVVPVWNADLCAAARERAVRDLDARATCLMVGVDEHTLPQRSKP